MKTPDVDRPHGPAPHDAVPVSRGGGGWAVFGCCDAGYVPRMLVALASVRRHNPAQPCFLFADGFADADLPAARRAGVGLVRRDPSLPFIPGTGERGSPWPRQSFGHLLAWRELSAAGYERSISIDGDVWCPNRLPLDRLRGGYDLACVCNGSVGRHFRIRESRRDGLVELGSSWRATWRGAANSGVVVWNHPALERRGFGEKILALHREESGRLWLPSDQHLLALAFARLDLRVRWLDTRWNFCGGHETGGGKLHLVPPQLRRDSWCGDLGRIYFLHLFKPWELLGPTPPPFPAPPAGRLAARALSGWIALAGDLYGPEWPARLGCAFPQARPAVPPGRWREALAAGAARLAAPGVAVQAFLRREGAAVVSALAGREPADLHPPVLARVVPALLPGRILARTRRDGP